MQTWSVRSAHWVRSVLRHQLEHSRIEIAGAEKSQVLLSHHLHDCHHDIMAGFTWLIKFLGDKLLYGHVPDPFPRCRIGYGDARLTQFIPISLLYSIFCNWCTLRFAIYHRGHVHSTSQSILWDQDHFKRNSLATSVSLVCWMLQCFELQLRHLVFRPLPAPPREDHVIWQLTIFPIFPNKNSSISRKAVFPHWSRKTALSWEQHNVWTPNLHQCVAEDL